MKILYIAAKWDYGDPQSGYSFEYYNFYDALTKMEKGKHHILYFPVDEVLKEKGREKMNKNLTEVVFREKPDLAFFFNGGEEIKIETIREISLATITFNWFADDHWKFERYSRFWAQAYHWVSTTDPEAIPKYHKIGYRNVILTQWACNHFIYKPLNLPKIYDVTFVGGVHGSRKKNLKEIEKEGINVKCWGRGWPEGRISQDKMIRIFSQSKINLNFTKCSGILWKELGSMFLYRRYDNAIRMANPKYWLANAKATHASLVKKQIKGRNFEIPGLESFCLTECVNNLGNYYEIDKEIVCFENSKDLIEKIKYYLSHEEEREAITKAGYERTLQDHTYEKRFQEIFQIMGLT